ncbi:MAG: hypothetical protein LWW94_05675 [Candidatus Desulfofervidaceae bacterium]|nr:hypothetical protein [Candidatus Desulfofervidaceae bacterium]
MSLQQNELRNIAESDEGLIFTGGLGFGLKWFQLDIAAQVSTKKDTLMVMTSPVTPESKFL